MDRLAEGLDITGNTPASCFLGQQRVFDIGHSAIAGNLGRKSPLQLLQDARAAIDEDFGENLDRVLNAEDMVEAWDDDID